MYKKQNFRIIVDVQVRAENSETTLRRDRAPKTQIALEHVAFRFGNGEACGPSISMYLSIQVRVFKFMQDPNPS